MSDLRQAAQAVLNRWDSPNWEWKHYGSPRFLPTATLMSALRKALAEQQAEPVSELQKRYLESEKAFQQQAEPVAWIVDGGKKNGELLHTHEYALELVAPKIMCKPLYTTPPQRKPLTNEQADQIISGLQTCHHQSSKREFLKVWLRDWASHGIKEGT